MCTAAFRGAMTTLLSTSRSAACSHTHSCFSSGRASSALLAKLCGAQNWTQQCGTAPAPRQCTVLLHSRQPAAAFSCSSASNQTPAGRENGRTVPRIRGHCCISQRTFSASGCSASSAAGSGTLRCSLISTRRSSISGAGQRIVSSSAVPTGGRRGLSMAAPSFLQQLRDENGCEAEPVSGSSIRFGWVTSWFGRVA